MLHIVISVTFCAYASVAQTSSLPSSLVREVQEIKGNFTYCNIINEKTIVNLALDCRQRAVPKSNNISQVNVLVLEKMHNVLDTTGYECSKKKIEKSIERGFFNGQVEHRSEKVIQLSRLECLIMIESRQCDHEPMECSDEGCAYTEEHELESKWFSTTSATAYTCKFFRRKVVAERNDSRLFAYASNECTPPSLYCSLRNSIVVWNASDVHKLMYRYVHYGENYTLKGNLVYSSQTRYLFQLASVVNEFDFTMHKTTDGLYVVLEAIKRPPLQFKSNRAYFEFRTQVMHEDWSTARPRIMDAMQMATAEQDYELESIEAEFKSKFGQEFIKDCALFQNHLNLLAALGDNQFHVVRDLAGQTAIVYSKLGQLIVPKCQVFEDLVLSDFDSKQLDKDADECFYDMPVLTRDEENKLVKLFLTRQNFLIDKSVATECARINSRQMLNSTHFLVRVGKTAKIVAIAAMKVVDLTSQNFDFASLNFNHSSQVYEGFEAIDNFHDLPTGEPSIADLEERFHVLPDNHPGENHHSTFGSFGDELQASLESVWAWLTKVVYRVTCFLGLALCAYVLYQIFLCYLSFRK